MVVRWLCKRHADPLLSNPDHRAVTGRGVACHHQAKLPRDEGGIVDIDCGEIFFTTQRMTEPPAET